MLSERIIVVSRDVLHRSVPIMLCPVGFGNDEAAAAISSGSVSRHFGNAEIAQRALEAISKAYRLVDREQAENDPSLKQVIPYVIVRWGESVFLMRRLRAQSEERLWDKYSIGIGGHLNAEDAGSVFPDILSSGMERELHEELAISTEYACRLIGCINDDTNDVGRVHFGIAFQACLSNDNVRVRERSKMTGGFVDIEHLSALRPKMESWSRILLEHFLCRRT